MQQNLPKVIVYIDGLNLYKRLLVSHPDLKWLDLLTLCERMLPGHDLVAVRYFTSKVKPAQNDPQSPMRQEVYWRALRTLGPRLTMHFGRMETRDRIYPLAPKKLDSNGNLVLAKVRKTEEKKSDVSLASYLMLDAAKARADVYVLLSSDSDFEPTLELAKHHLGVKIGLISPLEKPSSSLLAIQPLFTKILRASFLHTSQLPDILTDSKGSFHKPDRWVKKQDPLTK